MLLELVKVKVIKSKDLVRQLFGEVNYSSLDIGFRPKL